MPEGVVVDPTSGLLAVALRDPDQLALVDPRDGRVRRRVKLPAPARHLALDPAGSTVLVPAESANLLIYVSLPGGKMRTVEVGAHPHDATVAAGRVYVADEFGDSVSVLRGGRLADSLDAPVQPGGIATAEGYVALIAVRQRVLETYDARTESSLGTIDAGEGPTHVETCGRRAFVVDTEGDAILEFRVGRHSRQTASTPAPGTPYGIAADCRRRTLWVTLTARNELVAYGIAPAGLKRLASFPTVRQPNSVAVDPSSGDAFVTASEGRVLERIPPPGAAR